MEAAKKVVTFVDDIPKPSTTVSTHRLSRSKRTHGLTTALCIIVIMLAIAIMYIIFQIISIRRTLTKQEAEITRQGTVEKQVRDILTSFEEDRLPKKLRIDVDDTPEVPQSQKLKDI